ncbi:flagellar biosynthetic protein FliO [Sporosarcina luteola]|uniref:flagellar biosynthetic protein FliO n=1 Tax=Sporosarcina luteola TaxID=582850 RepID=UPI002041BC14|nr:flagellar biosynthetic protein FliO [Sporosarcina luteola]MCM3742844.1 flagellar biosynthetic protein FliO [Sporosarcina luteola]
MNLSVLQKFSSIFLLAVVLLSTLPLVAHAEDNPAKSVADWYGKDKEKEKEKEKEKDSGEKSTNVIEEDEPAADRTQEGAAAVGLSWWDYVKTLLALLFVAGLLLALLKFINRKNRMFGQHRLMKNVGGLSLGQQKSIQLVVIGESYYLIGVGDEVRLLKEITDPQEIAALESYFDDDELPSSAGVVDKLLTMLPIGNGKSSEDREQPADFKKMFASRLDELKAERKKHLKRLAEKESRKDE